MYKLIRLDTAEIIELNEYYQNWLNKGSIEGIRRKYNLCHTLYGYCLIQKEWNRDEIVPGHILDIIEVPDEDL